MGVEVKTGEKVTGRWGQWCRHDFVWLDGECIGRIQTRRRYYGRRIGHRVECITLNNQNACVMGSNIDWLVGQSAK